MGPIVQELCLPEPFTHVLKARFLAKKMSDMGIVHHFGSNAQGVWVQKEVESAKLSIDCDEDVVALLPQGTSLSDLLS